MKIAIDCRMSGKSGIGTFLDEILPFFLKTENEFILFGDKASPAGQTETGSNCEFISCSIKTFSLKEMFSFPAELLKKINECDVYFSPYCNVPGGIKIPVYTTIHDIVFLDVKGLTGKAGTAARKFFYKRAVRKSKGIFTVSQFSKERIQKKLSCKKEITVVYNGLPSYLQSSEQEKNTEKSDSVIFIGNIKRHKGLKTLLEAFPKFCSASSGTSAAGAKLIIVGSQDNFRTKDDTLSSLIEKIPSEKIEFTGFVSNETLRRLLSSAKLLVQPSLYEGFGIPPLQALCAGTQAVISDIPVFKEIYGTLPVFFFKTEDSDSLTEKMLEAWNTPEDLSGFNNPYSYKNTAELIIKQLFQ
ncbi:MAG: glycosyltransferase family 4 protein [Treponema sp.]|nr:glycosyltransferase family 4 protein [Treponema sp.]